jgi:peptide subunit release factor RF-3
LFHFRYINNADPLKAKQLDKGIDQLMDEGVAQLFTLEMIENHCKWIKKTDKNKKIV